ncbi:MAG: hypothetical protein IJ366_04580 [Clostridia bacterium]|nr:hypothetical protein [Clostridia bacterium]
MDNDKLLLRRIADISALCDKYNTPRFSDFLDEAEQAKVKLNYADLGGVWFGGYDGAARQILGFFPDWFEPQESEFPIAAVKITNKGTRRLTHRDYLGTIMSLGLERRKIGDIAVSDTYAYVFVASDVAEVVGAIDKIAACGVKCDIVPLSECVVPEAEYKLSDVVAASMRLDAVVGAVCNFSRKNAADYIASGKCEVNHIAAIRCDQTVKEGDLLSLRGLGRVQIMHISGETRSGRLHITIKKFI